LLSLLITEAGKDLVPVAIEIILSYFSLLLKAEMDARTTKVYC
jgi:hypothetical protein